MTDAAMRGDTDRALSVALVAIRRPELLECTLASFHDALLKRVRVTGAAVNIDPVAGDATAQAECRRIVAAYLPGARIVEPDKPGFAKAVQTVWMAAGPGPVLHMEDDWVFVEPPDIDAMFELLTGDIAAVSFFSAHHQNATASGYMEAVRHGGLRALPPFRRRVPIFNTSPGLFDGCFAKRAAGLFDLHLDPEKQMRRGRNPALGRYLSRFRCRVLRARDGGPLIEDIGRAWNAQRGIKKTVDGAHSRWVEDR